MSFEFYRSFVHQHIMEIPDDLWNAYLEVIERKEYEKNDFVLEEGKIENHLFHLLKLVLQDYLHPKETAKSP